MVSLIELLAWVLAFGGLMALIVQRRAARDAGRPVKRLALALSIAAILIGIAIGIFGVATGTVPLV